jgi:hypothetical protein
MNCNLRQTRRTKTKELNSIRLDVDVVFENCYFFIFNENLRCSDYSSPVLWINLA